MVAVSSVVFVGLLALAPNWAIVDIPYPDSNGGAHHALPSTESQVTDALLEYAKGRSLALQKGDVTDLKVEGARATARLHVGARFERVHLEYHNQEWRVVRVE
jgi:Ser/Thr protein kinase RdoA (MazF antagonist)